MSVIPEFSTQPSDLLYMKKKKRNTFPQVQRQTAEIFTHANLQN